MSFDPLPGISVAWTATELAPGAFLRYEVWRRVTGTTAWTKLARVTNAAQLGYADYKAVDGVLYDYGVTQVEDVGGQEVSSVMSTPAQASITVNNLFVHDVTSAGNYVELWPQMLQGQADQAVLYVQPRNTNDPVPHVGHALTQKATWRCVVPKTDTEMWPGLLSLQQRQRDDGSTLVVRGANGYFMYCTIAQLQRDFGQYNANLFTIFLTLQRTNYDPSVD